MKIFITAIVILLVLIGGVTANAVFLHNRFDTLIDIALRLPEDLSDGGAYQDAARELSALWGRTHPITAVTVSAARIEHVDRAINNLKASFDTADATAYREARAELILLLRRLRAVESCSLSSII